MAKRKSAPIGRPAGSEPSTSTRVGEKPSTDHRGRGRGRGGRGGGRGGRKPRQDEKPVDGDKLDDALDSWRKKGGLKTVEPTALDEQLEAYKAKDAANGDEAAE
eukprot:TRINITY_DN11956_c0_g6_i1.p1 TRINITY_DN11956_c0_g6~~TRINITY_DN11956_c0_g6_i1.p1  ORF type:complete len:112 (+),score=41.39 TRINITY_DN11956_c0_g6_i1:27-338(+)